MDASRILEELKEIGAIGAPGAAKVAEALEMVEKDRPAPEPMPTRERDPKMLRQIDQAIVHLSALVEIFQEIRGALTTESARDLRLVKETPKPERAPAPAELLPTDPVAYEKARQAALAKIRGEAHLVPDPVAASVVSVQNKKSSVKDEDIIASSAENRARPVKESELISLGSSGTRRLDA